LFKKSSIPDFLLNLLELSPNSSVSTPFCLSSYKLIISIQKPTDLIDKLVAFAWSTDGTSDNSRMIDLDIAMVCATVRRLADRDKQFPIRLIQRIFNVPNAFTASSFICQLFEVPITTLQSHWQSAITSFLVWMCIERLTPVSVLESVLSQFLSAVNAARPEKVPVRDFFPFLLRISEWS